AISSWFASANARGVVSSTSRRTSICGPAVVSMRSAMPWTKAATSTATGLSGCLRAKASSLCTSVFARSAEASAPAIVLAQLFMGLVERRGSFGDAGLQGLVEVAQPRLADLERAGALLGSFARRDQVPLIGSAIGRIDEQDPRTDRSAVHIHSPPFRQDRQAPAFSASQINGDLPDDALPVKKRRHMGLEKNPTGR
ncbi:hypothetical protein LTR94_031334, partial [Friedmanniomyces endolithicus]